MNNKNWQQIETLFHTALDLDVKERSEYLNRSCIGDAALRREVESLLSSWNQHNDILEKSVFETGIELMGKTEKPALTGKTIGSYLIGEKLGSGGMGEVYLAEDMRLSRKVALKFLSHAFIDDKWAKRQLVKEARAAAMLEHPNICAVYGFEETDNYSFIVMQYVEGQTLAELISRGVITNPQVLPIGRQILEALATAHSHGIIHRDIKPGNIMVTPGGHVKVLDFGLAKLIQKHPSAGLNEALSQASQNGLIAGTVAYMSPEQLRGEKLDFRSDIFSLGTLLFELVCGERPFSRKSDAETISAILSAPPPSLKSAAELAPGIENLIYKCLAKDKEQRYQSVSEILLDLQNPAISVRMPRLFTFDTKRLFAFNKRLLWYLVGLFLFLILVTSIGVSYFQKTKAHRLAVLPIVNQSADPELNYLSEGMTEDLINRIGDSSNLFVKPYTTVSGIKSDKLDYFEIAQKLGVDTVVVGKLVKRDDKIFIQSSLVNVADGFRFWEEEIALTPADTPLAAEEKISQKVISSFDLAENRSDTAKKPQTTDPEAFKYYMLGQYYWRDRSKENLQKAIEAFQNAIIIDPLYARAYAGLANAYVVQSNPAYGAASAREAKSKAKEAAKKALALDENLAESHAAIAVVVGKYEYNWSEAESEYKRAIELNPNYAQAHYWYSEYLSTMGRTDEALIEAEKAKELDPFSPYPIVNVGRILYFGRRYDEGLKYFHEVIDKNPNYLKARYMLGLLYIQKEMYSEALAVFERLYDSDEKALAAAALGYTYGKIGRREDARRILAQMDESANPFPPQEKAIVHIGLGEKEQAIKYLEDAYQKQLATLTGVKVEPLYDDLRSEPEFTKMLFYMHLNDPN